MKPNFFKKGLSALIATIAVLFIVNCSSDDSSGGDQSPTASSITITGSLNGFGDVNVLSSSASQSIVVKGNNLSASLMINVSDNFQISQDNAVYTDALTFSASEANSNNLTVYVRFSPLANSVGPISGTLTLASESAATQTISLSGNGLSIAPLVNLNVTSINFEGTQVASSSNASVLLVDGDNLDSPIDMSVTDGFELSLDNAAFSNAVQIPMVNANDQTTVFVRFSPTVIGANTGTVTISNSNIDPIEVALSGEGLPIIHNYVTFDSERLAFGSGFNQSSTQTFNLHDDMSNIETIKMYVQLRCPSVGCDEWDVYANVKVRDPESGELYELGRYITPYWNDNSQLDRGFEFDVTDFKSLLSGSTELRIRTECWNDRGYEVTVDFDFIEGTPDYPYYAISRVMAYDDWSTSGVPYGVDHNFDLTKSVSIPGNAESTHLRTIISGWGHATPNDPDGRPCAEWCYRTHDVKINGSTMFQHNMGPLGCAANPVSNQSPGNWQPDRAGWCPGMVVPARHDQFSGSMAGSSFAFEYDYANWTSDGANGDAFYATSTFVVVKSNSPISKPVVTE